MARGTHGVWSTHASSKCGPCCCTALVDHYISNPTPPTVHPPPQGRRFPPNPRGGRTLHNVNLNSGKAN